MRTILTILAVMAIVGMVMIGMSQPNEIDRATNKIFVIAQGSPGISVPLWVSQLRCPACKGESEVISKELVNDTYNFILRCKSCGLQHFAAVINQDSKAGIK